MRRTAPRALACPLVLAAALAASLGSGGCQIQHAPSSLGWRDGETGILENHVQLTFADRFVKAGECYFSPDDSMVVFQATEVPEGDAAPSPFYAMYVADVLRRGGGRIAGLANIRRVSPPGSANTCGWFHPTEPDVVIFASTVTPPTRDETAPGYQRGSGRYEWRFPREMRIVSVDLDEADGTAATVKVICGDTDDYQAECSYTGDGRHLLYCSLETAEGDIYVRDGRTGVPVRLVEARGYDGGPFFSPDDKRICYRSDRNNDDLLQLFVADLEYDADGAITGAAAEHQLTANAEVNWCPFWHPGGRHLVYSTSELGHYNYEIFIIDAAPGRYGKNKRRVTHFGASPVPGAAASDVLPAFTHDGRAMVWTSRRGPRGTPQLWAADFVMELD